MEVTATIILPSRIYALVGKETNIYWTDIVYSNAFALLDFNITCVKGLQNEKYYRYTPLLVDVGNYTWKLDVYFGGVIIATKTITIYVVANAPIAFKVLGVGDSTLAGILPIISTENPGQVTFIGTQGVSPNLNEGRGGWMVSDFSTVGRTFYKYYVSGIAVAPALNSVYSDGVNKFTVTEINLTLGTGYINTNRTTGTTTSAPSGTLTRFSGTGDATLTYSSWVTTSGNPFWNGALDFSNYLVANSFTMSAGDWVFIHLGINDIFSSSNPIGLFNGMITNLRSLITNMQASVAGLKIGVCITIPPTISQDGFGANYLCGKSLYEYLQALQVWQQRLITEFDTDAERALLRFLIPFNAIVDRENNFQMGSGNSNARNTMKINYYTNGVHPAQPGYNQMADGLLAMLKS